MAGSIEYEILVHHTADLQRAVRDNLTPLGAELVSAEIITPSQYREIRNPHRPVDERGADLVEYVQNKVLQNPQHYYAFIEILWSDLSQYDDILTKLEHARLLQESEWQPVTPQSPPPREDDNQLPAQGTRGSSRNPPLSPSTRENLHQRIHRETRLMKYKFSNLQTLIRENLNISPRVLATHIIGMYILSKEDETRMINASSIEDIFIILTKYWSFLDFGHLENIAGQYCSTDCAAQRELEQYKGEVQEFCRRRVSELPQGSLNNGNDIEGMDKLVVTLDLNDPSLRHVLNLKEIIANILGQPASKLVLYDIGSGSVILTFWIATSLGKELFLKKPDIFTQEQRDKLKDVRVISLKFKEVFVYKVHQKANEAVREKRPLEKSAEEPPEKHPRLEGGPSEADGDSRSANVAHRVYMYPLLKHRPKLAAFYLRQPEVPDGTWPPVKKTQYINLALIRTEQAIDFSKEFLRQTIRGSIDDIMKDKDDINYDEVFTELEEGTTLLFEGRPGCGKTTMMNKVSQDWAKWKFFSSCLLFLVHLRRFGNRSDINLETVLRSTPVDFSKEEFQQIQTHIEDNQGEGVVFALDGLDEYCPDKKEMKTTFVHKLIKGQILPKSVVIVASRPAASQKYRRDSTKCIEVLGFLKEQIYEYIDSYFKNKRSLVVGLRTYLEHHPNVMHMCYLPLHMAMVTYLYEVEGASLPQTETEIYRHFTLYTLLRSIRKRNDTEMEVDDEEFHLSSFDELQQEDRNIFDCILKFAYETTVVNPHQVFSAEEVKKFNDNLLGLVVFDKQFARYGLKEIYTFLHLTFQEFLSACHIVQLDPQAQEEIILKYGSDKSLGVVWKFYCGMTQFSGEKMCNFKQLVEKTKSEVLLHLRCAHESQQDILCTHTVNSYDSKIVLNSSSLNPADFTALGYVLTHSTVPATELTITSCNIGPEGLSALEKAANPSLAMKTLSFHGTKVKKMIPELCSVVKKFPQLSNMNFSSCGIINKSLSEMAEILPELASVEKLDLSCNDLGTKSVKVLCSLLTKLPKLKNLVWMDGLLTWPLLDTLIKRDVEINFVSKSSKSPLQSLGDFDVNSVSRYFQAHPCKAVCFEEFNLSNKSIGDTDVESLVKCLPHCINLRKLNLRHNNISDAGAQTLAEGLQHCSNLQILEFSNNNIGVAGAQYLVEGLQHCTHLQKLNVGYNGIGDAGAQALAKSLQHWTNLQELDLSRNNVGPAGAQALAEGLQHCTNLQKLNLYDNKIDDAGAQILVEGLQHCTNLQELNLQVCELTDSSVGSLSQLIRTAKQLKKLNLRFNNFTGDGKRALRAAAEERNSNPNFSKLDISIY